MLPVAPRIVNDVSYVMWINHEIHFAWQVQHLVKFMCHFSWQAQHLVKFMCHFSWQAQHVVNFRIIAGAGNVVIFNRICSWRVRKVALAARRVQFCVFWVGSVSDHSRIMLGSFSDRSRIGNDVSAVFSYFLSDLGRSFCVAGAVYLVRLEGVACCSAHCK